MAKLDRLVFVFVSLIISAHTVAQTHSLPAGWSLLGNDTGGDVDPVAVFGNATTTTSVSPSVTTVWTWDNARSQWNFFAPSMTPQTLSTYAATKGYGVLSTIVKGEGFWVNAKNAVSVNLASSAGSLTYARTELTTTLLQNGKVLVTGGLTSGNTATATAELYDSATNQWSVIPSMAAARVGHTATLLGSGKVLVVGGGNGSAGTIGAELYDPAKNIWAAAANPVLIQRTFHTATLLNNGKVLVVGGINIGGLAPPYVASAELYDPTTNSWTTLPNMNTAGLRYYHTATSLQDGKVLIAGGLDGDLGIASAELFDPTLNSWTTVGSLAAGSYSHSATLLSNGKVLLAGGAGTTIAPTRAELFDPTTTTWTAAANLATGRFMHIAQLLNDGKVLLAGGQVSPASIELYDPASNTWVASGNLAYARSQFGAAMLNSGKVLLVGGSAKIAELFQE